MTSPPRGRSAAGCLVGLLVVAGVAYLGFDVARVYVRFWRYQDAMAQQARFAPRTEDDVIIDRLRAKADSLKLPESAKNVHVRRAGGQIYIWSDYVDTIALPGFVRGVGFRPHAESAL